MEEIHFILDDLKKEVEVFIYDHAVGLTTICEK
jgi:hypothetical protein